MISSNTYINEAEKNEKNKETTNATQKVTINRHEQQSDKDNKTTASNNLKNTDDNNTTDNLNKSVQTAKDVGATSEEIKKQCKIYTNIASSVLTAKMTAVQSMYMDFMIILKSLVSYNTKTGKDNPEQNTDNASNATDYSKNDNNTK